MQAGGQEGSVWWRETISICDGGGSVLGSWFLDNLHLNVGNSASTLFWLDRCVSDVPLCDEFCRLYDLSKNKMAIVAQVFAWGWDARLKAWNWRRRLWVWEEDMVEECRIFLLTIMMKVDTKDVWRWTHDPVEGYIVSGAYRTRLRPIMSLRHSYGGRMSR